MKNTTATQERHINAHLSLAYPTKPWKAGVNPVFIGKACYVEQLHSSVAEPIKLSTVVAYTTTPMGQLILETINSRYEIVFSTTLNRTYFMSELVNRTQLATPTPQLANTNLGDAI